MAGSSDLSLWGRFTPEQVEAIAAQLFSECLRHGYTSLCEFHYIQRDPRGALYARPAEMAERVAAAGQGTGIGLTLLPVLYSYSGFGEQALKPEQARFRTDAETVLRIVEALAPLRSGQLEVGAAPHSLRAATIGQVRELAAQLHARAVQSLHLLALSGTPALDATLASAEAQGFRIESLEVPA